MTAPDIEQMTDAQLAAEAAKCMGWNPDGEIVKGSFLDGRDSYQRWTTDIPFEYAAYPRRDFRIISGGVFLYDPAGFHPCQSLSDAGELGAAFLKAWPGSYFRVSYLSDYWRCEIVATVVIADVTIEHPSEARCRTVAVITAWRALKEVGNSGDTKT